VSQRIHLAAIVERDGLLWLVREHEDAEWELPGGALLPGHVDTEAGMATVLAAFGVRPRAIEDGFIETLYLPEGEGHVVYNLYAAGEWHGEPAAAGGLGSAWLAPHELDSVRMNDQVREAILDACGIRERADMTAALMERLQAGVAKTATDLGVDGPPAPSSADRRARGLDVLRTLSGGSDPASGHASLRNRYGPLGDDVVDFAMGEVWAAAGLDRRTRSLQVVAMLSALGRTGPLQGHIGGALNHGATPQELVETVRMVAVYAGFPAALDAWQVMAQVFEARGIEVPGGAP
jgi:4-carboxymuconolactone decarboxylase